MTKPSASGLFEVWGGCVVEGDAVTPTRIPMVLVATLPTSEGWDKCEVVANAYRDFEYLEVRAPKAFIERHAKLEAIKRARRCAEDTTPF